MWIALTHLKIAHLNAGVLQVVTVQQQAYDSLFPLPYLILPPLLPIPTIVIFKSNNCKPYGLLGTSSTMFTYLHFYEC